MHEPLTIIENEIEIRYNALSFCRSRHLNDFCSEIGVGSDAIFKVLLTADKNYREYQIPKKKGGFRNIEAPENELKFLQQKLNHVLQMVYHEMKPSCVHGFIQNYDKHTEARSIVTNAKAHIRKRFVLNLDLADFFHSIDIWRVKQIFMSYPFYFTNDLASYIALLTTNHDRLPMGAPTSPVISNFACFLLDRKLMNLCKDYNFAYTRYADDLTFSSNFKIGNERIKEIEKIITDEGFIVNKKKTRLFTEFGRQTVTGLKVNDMVNVDRAYIRSIRAMLHNWEKYGVEVSSVRNSSEATFFNTLMGKLNFLKMVRGDNDLVYDKLMRKFYQLQDKQEKIDIKNFET
jgi:RNA-directed DNA polymerase